MSKFIILAIPFLGTSLGSAMVFFLKKRIAPKFEKMLLGFAAGVMIAASVWSLLIPSIRICVKGTARPNGWLRWSVFLQEYSFFCFLIQLFRICTLKARTRKALEPIPYPKLP